MTHVLQENEQKRMMVSEVKKSYENSFVFATNAERDAETGHEFCIPRIVCSSVQHLSENLICTYKENETTYGVLLYLNTTTQPDLLFF